MKQTRKNIVGLAIVRKNLSAYADGRCVEVTSTGKVHNGFGILAAFTDAAAAAEALKYVGFQETAEKIGSFTKWVKTGMGMDQKIIAAAVMGTQAFKAGIGRAPALDKAIEPLLAGNQVGEGLPILKAWLASWDAANLCAPLPNVEGSIENQPIIGTINSLGQVEPLTK